MDRQVGIDMIGGPFQVGPGGDGEIGYVRGVVNGWPVTIKLVVTTEQPEV